MRRSLCPLIYLLWRTGRISPCWDVWPRDPRTSVSWSGLCYNQNNSPEPEVSPGEHVWGVFSNSRMMIIWWHVSDSAQYDNSCPVTFVFSVRHVETRGAFPHIFDISDKSPRVCFIEKHKQHFIDILLFMEATMMKKFNNSVCFLQWWIHISLYIVQLLVKYFEFNFHQKIKMFL